MKKLIMVVLTALLWVISSCMTVTPELITALSEDNASFCLNSDLRGGVGGVTIGSGGYGQSTLSFCRSNHSSAILSLKPDGSMSIEHK